ncbi:hypothetical protein INR49_007415 [Caranx melampygus]|nr:hypothetical protein INR49_007415 [Caranx melampygus]
MVGGAYILYRVSLDDDVLLPYVRGHGPSHSHRHVRDCQPTVHGNTTHEIWSSSNHSGLPLAESTVSHHGGPRPAEDGVGAGAGRAGRLWMKQRATVEETAEAAGCLYAQNAGFFNTGTGECHGNIVSNGQKVQDSGGVQNAQFGIRRDGTLVFGYLSQEEVLDQSNPFVQLVSGVVWLLRNGEVYINQSLEAGVTRPRRQVRSSAGAFHEFVDVVSARTAVGHDAEGKLILFHIDGQTGVRGSVTEINNIKAVVCWFLFTCR